MRLTTRRKVAAGFGAALLVIGAVGVVTYRSMSLFVGTTAAVGRAQEVLTRLEEAFGLISDAEAGSRGYIITGDARYLEPYHAARSAVARRLAEIRRLTADEPRSQAHVRALEPLVERRFAVIEEGIALRRTAGLDAARALVQTGRGRAVMDSIRRLIDETEADQTQILRERTARERSAAGRIRVALALGFLTAFGLTALATLIVHRDLAERAEAQAEAMRAKEAAERASRAKSDFLARMSHELRTPLNSVIGFANVLLKNARGALSPRELTYVDRIQANGTQLLALINDVLDLSKIEAGRMRLERVPVALDALVPDVLASFEGQLRDRDIELRAVIPRGLTELRTDPARLQQVLVNLVGNALKFTERGSVTVDVEMDTTSGAPVRIDVIDTGIGIAADRQRAIFDAFEQADSSTSRRYGGTGLGLAISKSLCELMGYRLDVHSDAGRGSVFSIRLVPGAPSRRAGPEPSAAAELAAAAPARATERDVPAAPSGRLVLVVDDDADSRTLLAHQLEELGCEAIVAGSGEQGLDRARDRRPDLILLDLMMPGMSGWEVLERLKADPALRDIPVVIVSIVAGENRGRILGAVDLIDKPVTRGELFAALRRNLMGARGQVLVVAEDADAQRVLVSYLKEAGELAVTCAGSGREALAALDGALPDLIVLDQMMPTVDGLELLETLRGDHRSLDVPVIIVTARGLSAPGVERLQMEARAVLARGPVLESDLRRVVREVWGRQAEGRRGSDELEVPAAR